MNVEEHPVFERDGTDVHVRVRLSLSEAVLGTKVKLAHERRKTCS